MQMIDLCKVHTHGTGTALGDPIETSSVFMAVYGILGLQSCPTICFSAIKSSIGHSEASSGADSFFPGSKPDGSFNSSWHQPSYMS